MIGFHTFDQGDCILILLKLGINTFKLLPQVLFSIFYVKNIFLNIQLIYHIFRVLFDIS